MQPEIDLLGIPIKTFGVAFAFAFLACGLIAHRRLKELGKPADWAYEVMFAALIGGLVGARIDYLIQNFDKVKGDLLGNVFSGTGLVFIGGVIGGAVAVSLWAKWRGLLDARLLDMAAPAIALGYSIGRIGCQVSGDGDYGIASSLPWAMPYPHGTVPTMQEVHPTPIYETLAMGLAAWWLWRMRDHVRPGMLFPLYLVIAGVERLLVEFIRRNPSELLGLTTPQVESVIAIVAGVTWLAVSRHRHGPIVTSSPTGPRPAPA